MSYVQPRWTTNDDNDERGMNVGGSGGIQSVMTRSLSSRQRETRVMESCDSERDGRGCFSHAFDQAEARNAHSWGAVELGRGGDPRT